MPANSDRATRFRDLHRPGKPLVLPNAWDAVSARLIEQAGSAAIATTSAGVAWSLGAADGNPLGRDEAIRLIARVVAAVGVPVTADIEGGYAVEPHGVAETVTLVIQAGAVGVNIEDADHSGAGPLLAVSDQMARIAAAREAANAAGVALFLNARIDTYLAAVGPENQRLQATIERAKAYLEAGADGIFVPGAVDPETVAALTAAISAPLNIMAGPGTPSVATLAGLGVARVSVGPWITARALAATRQAAAELLDQGTYGAMADAIGIGELDALMSR